ncbi:YeeE/YedE family protein [Pseudaquabacterium pictum]|uniref:Membrane protein n=1 Tax=Pseudaquabacterium pictum TaxID=2315236 RepID=A0A480AY71_9BURK|nr:YeeE/YedE family protein [Rubrivivax pictus]GCL64695.1 membrane protein [Rubrivivax pictus]
MQESDVQALTALVLGSAFGLSVLFGAIAQRTHFCTMGAVADVVNMGDWTRLRMWVLAIAVAVLGFNGMVGAGWIAARDSLYAGPQLPWLSALVGGLLFGFGMVLASGCGSKSLVRLGAGNLKSGVVLLVLAVSGMATLKGITAVLRVHTVDAAVLPLPSGQDLPSLLAAGLGLPVPQMALLLGALVAGVLLAWVLRRPEGRSAEVWLGGAGIGAVVVGLWWVSGRLGFVAEHPVTLEPSFLATNSRRMEALSMAAPVAYALDWLLFFSDSAKVLTIGIVSVVGVVAGSAAVALATGSFRWEGFGGVGDLAHHLAGGVLMGVGGVTALGCSIGQGLSGVSTLALGSLLALAAIAAGSVLALRYQAWLLDREG